MEIGNHLTGLMLSTPNYYKCYFYKHIFVIAFKVCFIDLSPCVSINQFTEYKELYVVNPFPHITNMQQTTLKTSWQKCWKISINDRVKHIVANEPFQLCHSVFKSCLLQRCLKGSIWGKGLRGKDYRQNVVMNPLFLLLFLSDMSINLAAGCIVIINV